MKKLLFIALLGGSGLHGFGQTFSLIADSIRKYRSIPGLVYAVCTADKLLDTSCSGVRVFRMRENIRYTDHFFIGTNTTAFTSYIALKLVQEGKIKWQSNIVSVLPELDGKIKKPYHRITLHQLLAQRSGIPEFPADSEYMKLAPRFTGRNIVEQRKQFAQLALQQLPRLIIDSSVTTYSTGATIVAAAMLEKASGKSWEELVEHYINKPLGIRAITSQRIPDSIQATGHSYQAGLLNVETRYPPERLLTVIAPANGINIRPKDYIIFLQALLKGLQTPATATAFEKMLFGSPGNILGWENDVWKGFHISYGLGKDAYYSCYAEIIKEKNTAILVLCNSGPSVGRSVALNFARLMRMYYSR